MKTPVTQFQTDPVTPGKKQATFLGRRGPVLSANGQMIFWEFEVIQDDEAMVVSGVTSDSFSHDPRCKAMKWAKLLDPQFNDESAEWDDTQAIGLPIGIDVQYFDRGGELTPTVKELFKWPSTKPAT